MSLDVQRFSYKRPGYCTLSLSVCADQNVSCIQDCGLYAKLKADPSLSEFVKLMKLSGLEDALKGELPGLDTTIFVPNNDALDYLATSSGLYHMQVLVSVCI